MSEQRQSVAALALIRCVGAATPRWLAQWNENWNGFTFVGGHKRVTESFRECTIREVAEELRLRAGRDYIVSDGPRDRLEYMALSRSAAEQTQYTVELFDVHLLGLEAEQRVASIPTNRWLLESEIREKACQDGRAVSETMELLFTMARLWSHKSPPFS